MTSSIKRDEAILEEMFGGDWSISMTPARGRRCGGCTLCCTLLPTRELNLKAGEKCPHQKFNGCGIYKDRPRPCRLWSCKWLTDETTAELRRPDKSHYVVDSMPDYVTADPEDGTPPVEITVVQVWVDPAYPDAHEDTALRRWLDRQGEKGIAAIVRYSSTDAFTLFPPSMTGVGWQRIDSELSEPTHTAEQVADVVGGLKR